jgi:type I restriction enzyme R subunit
VESPVPVLGMKVDRMFFERFEDQVRKDVAARRLFEHGDISAAEEHIRTNIFDRPEDFFNLEKLRKAVQLDRRLTLREILEKVFGAIDRFKTREELLDDELAKFISIHKPEAGKLPYISAFLKAYLSDGHIRAIIDSGEFTRLADNPRLSISDLFALGKEWRNIITDYVKDYIYLNKFAA